jgi:hypothetical protein
MAFPCGTSRAVAIRFVQTFAQRRGQRGRHPFSSVAGSENS